MTPDELVKKWQHVLDRARHIWTWTEPHALAYCCERAAAAGPEANGVELGTYLGASAFVMLCANPRLHLWAVDHFVTPGVEHTARHFLRYFIAEGRCEIIVGDSARAASMLPHMKDRLDFIWVDDGHSEADLQRDIKSFQPLMKKGSLMFGHDFDVPHNDVARGVLSVIPEREISIPVPRVWQWSVGDLKKGCCGT